VTRTIAVLGSGGLLGPRILRLASSRGDRILAARSTDVDARDRSQVSNWLQADKPDVLIITAARTGGVHANLKSPADMLDDNAQIALAAIGAARSEGIERVLYCSSAAIYADTAHLPCRESDAGSGSVDASHFGYASAKLLGARFCSAIRRQDGLDYTALLLTGMYGPGQSYDPSRSHVAAALLARIHRAHQTRAPEVVVWGTGAATRDLLFVEDAAEAVLHLTLADGPEDGLINVASGRETTIRELAETVADAIGYKGALVFDASKPEGARRRVLDISRLNGSGWAPRYALAEGIRRSVEAYSTALAGRDG
jgi:GDP-L-fucose synthase